MNRKVAQRIAMVRDFGFMVLLKKQVDVASREVNVYESSHGFGFADDYDEADYGRFVETDEGFKALWSEHCKAMDEWKAALDRFCESMERFTDGQVDRRTAREMATNPRYSKRLEAIMMEKVA